MSTEIDTLNQIAQPLKQSITYMLALHGGGLIASAAFTAAADVVFEKMLGKKHPLWMLIIYSVVIGIVYRGYTTDWIYHIKPVATVAVALVGAGYGILSIGIYFAILKPLKAGAVKFLKSKLRIR